MQLQMQFDMVTLGRPGASNDGHGSPLMLLLALSLIGGGLARPEALTTIRIVGHRFNTAIAALDPPLVNGTVTATLAALRNDQSGAAPAGCAAASRVVASVLACAPLERGCVETDVGSFGGDGDYRCRDARNFRVAGPEDARLVSMGGGVYVVLYNAPAGSNRRQYVRSLDPAAGVAAFGPARELGVSGGGPPLGRVEKNWVPFYVGGRLHVWQWLAGPGGAISYRVDVATGSLYGRAADPAGGAALRRAVLGGSGSAKAVVSGGTPGLRLNASTFLGLGHVQRRRRYYSCFAYWFSASPPFRLLAATREFRFPDVGRGGALVEAESAGKPGPEDRIQFPMGVARAAAGDAVLVSWGAKANAESRVTALPLAALAPLTTALR